MTTKEQAFVDLYDGNASQTAIKAGYKTKNPDVVGHQNLVRLGAEIKKREEKKQAPHIATRQERQAFWAEVMFSDKVGMNERLRASELLGKSEADFTEKLEHTGMYSVKPSEEMIALFDEFRERRKKLIDVS